MPSTGIANLANSPGAIVYTVQRYLWPLWHDVLSTSDRAKAYALKGDARARRRVGREDDRLKHFDPDFAPTMRGPTRLASAR